MKLLLTSSGIVSQEIANALTQLSGKEISQCKIAFIPTAANIEAGDKGWFLKQITDLYKFGAKDVDIVDISLSDIDWKHRLKSADIVYLGGGNTFFLLEMIRKSGVDVWLKENMDQVFVGASAGSIVLTPSIAIAAVEPGDENHNGLKDLTALSLVDFEISPHSYDLLPMESNIEYRKTISTDLYCIDDSCAVLVNGSETKVLGSGKWEKI